MTRAFLAAGHGAWREALQQSPVGALLFPGAIVLAVVSGWHGLRRTSGAQQSDPRIPRLVWMGAALMLAANWIYRLLAGLK